MIASLSGTVTALLPAGVVVRVGGVGVAVQVTVGTLARLRVGEQVELATSLVVREDSLTLYGFEQSAERDLFELLQASSGVGPRLAQAVLTVHTPDTVRRALAQEDLAVLCQVPGIGRKGAQRMVLELKDRVGPVEAAGASAVTAGSWGQTLTGALVGLGWAAARVEPVVGQVATAHPDAVDADVPALLREALALLARP